MAPRISEAVLVRVPVQSRVLALYTPLVTQEEGTDVKHKGPILRGKHYFTQTLFQMIFGLTEAVQ